MLSCCTASMEFDIVCSNLQFAAISLYKKDHPLLEAPPALTSQDVMGHPIDQILNRDNTWKLCLKWKD